MTKKIYVVIGSSGRWDDHERHEVCAYEDEKLAEEHAKKAEEFSNNFVKNEREGTFPGYPNEHSYGFSDKMIVKYPNPWDDEMSLHDYTYYNVCTLEVLDKVPEGEMLPKWWEEQDDE